MEGQNVMLSGIFQHLIMTCTSKQNARVRVIVQHILQILKLA